jgi:predicted ATPase
MINKIAFKNFKSWKGPETINYAQLTGFFGTNSSGKSSLIQFLLLLKQTIESSDRNQVIDFGDAQSYTELGSFRELIYNHNVNSELWFNIEWRLSNDLIVYVESKGKEEVNLSGNTLIFEASIKQNGGNRIFVDKLAYQFASNRFELKHKYKGATQNFTGDYEIIDNSNNAIKFKKSVGRPTELPSPYKFYGFPDQVRAYFQNAGFLSDLQLQFEEIFKNVFYLGPLREHPKRDYKWTGSQPLDMGRRGEDVIDAILSSKSLNKKIQTGKTKGVKYFTLEEYVAKWLKDLGLIHSFSVKQIAEDSNLYKVVVKKNVTSSEVLITDVGFGVSQILPIIALCFYAPIGSTVLIEQPEIHLHPSVQSGLADVFIDAMEKRKIQIVLESHSEHLLRRLQRRIAESKVESSNIQLYFCKSDGATSRIEPLKFDLFGNIENWPDNFFGDELSEIAATQKAILKRKIQNG